MLTSSETSYSHVAAIKARLEDVAKEISLLEAEHGESKEPGVSQR